MCVSVPARAAAAAAQLTIWRIENFERAAWPRELYGHLYAGDSYILLYKYQVGT
jgi:hypothetical protein